MAFVSYAQNFEDAMLWRALQDVPAGAYIDLGAFDPVFHSVSRGFYEKGWRGTHVEASHEYSSRLRADRPDEVVIEAVMAETDENVEFFDFKMTGLSTTDQQIAAVHSQAGFEYETRRMPSMTLDHLFETLGHDPIHWLKIDVEGSETAVLRGWKQALQRPWIVLVEAIDPLTREENHAAWEPILLEKGYVFAYFDGLNRFYVWDEKPEMLRHFRYGICLWDDVVICRDHLMAAALV